VLQRGDAAGVMRTCLSVSAKGLTLCLTRRQWQIGARGHRMDVERRPAGVEREHGRVRLR